MKTRKSLSPYEREQLMDESEKAVSYMIEVWDEVAPTWRERPDHVAQKFLKAEKEYLEKYP
jgi:hypothetical protein